ncbi:MAG: NAD-dependent epimerase/dehydratase family protein [Acidobacteriota bacterium]|nr:MAG: NAD-dependent epimerase/dehydratase family protein [Acidobacteriota bacterium]
MIDSANLLIAGCGELGARIGSILSAGGMRVWGLRRRSERLHGSIEPIAADLSQPDTLADLPARFDLVVYTAAAERFDDPAYRRAYVDGMRHLLDALERQQQRPEKLLFTSSSSVYAQSDGVWVNEESPTLPTHFAGLRLLEAEDLLVRRFAGAIVLRLAGIYGPTRTRLIRQLESGEARCIERPPVYTNRIHLDDAARLAVHLLGMTGSGGVYLGVDHEPAEQCRVLRWLAKQLGVVPPQVVDEAAAGERGLRSNKRCSNRKVLATGFRFQFPTYREGYGAIIREMRGEHPS